MKVYRIVRKPYAATPFDGEGSFRFGGRWSNSGTRLVYTAENLSLAMIETLVRFDPSLEPNDLMLATAEIPIEVSRIQLTDQLPANWRDYPAPKRLQKIGDTFESLRKAAILIVPSALAPVDFNWILNPAHPDFHLIQSPKLEHFEFSPRLLEK